PSSRLCASPASNTTTLPSLNNDGLSSSANSGLVTADACTLVNSVPGSAARAVLTIERTARSTRNSSSPRTNRNAGLLRSFVATPPSYVTNVAIPATGWPCTITMQYCVPAVSDNRIWLIQRGRGNGPAKPRQPASACHLAYTRSAAAAYSDPANDGDGLTRRPAAGDNGANSDPPGGVDEGKDLAMTQTLHTSTSSNGSAGLDLGPAVGLVSKEEGHRQALAPEFVSLEDFSPLEVAYDFGRVRREDIEAGPRNIWRYKHLLPVPSNVEQTANTEPGFTRLIEADRLAAELGIRKAWVKDDTVNPTHSFKDRVVAVALAAAREFGFNVLACPSTGNLANAVAAAAARAGWDSVVLVPSSLERAKVLTTAVYDGSLIAIDGNYDDVNRLATELAGEHENWAFVNVNVRPYYSEGSKTL